MLSAQPGQQYTYIGVEVHLWQAFLFSYEKNITKQINWEMWGEEWCSSEYQ
jgi:hypothetical protein